MSSISRADVALAPRGGPEAAAAGARPGPAGAAFAPARGGRSAARLAARVGGGLVSAMAAVLSLVVALSYWDAWRESEAALDDFAQEQATLAQAAAADLSSRLEAARGDEAGARPSFLSRNLRALERPGERRVVLLPPGNSAVGTDGAPVDGGALEAARRAGAPTARLSRAEARGLGLAERTAMAGLSSVDGGPLGRWTVAVVSSAGRVRDREQHAAMRALMSVLFGGGVVFGFGTLALRRQRQELELEHELEVAAMGRRRDERLVRASRLATMGTLASGVAHEIATPLGVIAGRAEQLLPRLEGDERARRAAQAIVEQAGRIGEVVRGFLDVSRGGKPTVAATDPALLVSQAVRLVEHRFEQAGVGLSIDVPERLPAVHADQRLLEHALVNLLLNACEACERGGRVEVLARAEPSSVAFVVQDDGAGISPEVIARATEPFFTTKPDGKGNGLGLAITQEIVKMHHGSLSLAPRVPSGTRACLLVPCSPEAARLDAS